MITSQLILTDGDTMIPAKQRHRRTGSLTGTALSSDIALQSFRPFSRHIEVSLHLHISIIQHCRTGLRVIGHPECLIDQATVFITTDIRCLAAQSPPRWGSDDWRYVSALLPGPMVLGTLLTVVLSNVGVFSHDPVLCSRVLRYSQIWNQWSWKGSPN
jgi:hypothetical protein